MKVEKKAPPAEFILTLSEKEGVLLMNLVACVYGDVPEGFFAGKLYAVLKGVGIVPTNCLEAVELYKKV
jgi:hypothetical protein